MTVLLPALGLLAVAALTPGTAVASEFALTALERSQVDRPPHRRRRPPSPTGSPARCRPSAPRLPTSWFPATSWCRCRRTRGSATSPRRSPPRASPASRVRSPDGGSWVGYLHVKDVLDLLDATDDTAVPVQRTRGLPEVRADARLDAAVATLRASRAHLARAVDPPGTTVGLVALEDLVEAFVGTVRDATHRRV